jgi:hypothetical protein
MIEIRLLLKAVLYQEPPPSISSNKNQQKALVNIAKNQEELKAYWDKIYQTGLSSQLIENLSKIADENRSAFMDWRYSFEHTDDQMDALLYQADLDLIRKVSASLLHLSQFCREAQLSFNELRKSDQIPIPTLMQISDQLLHQLERIERILIESKRNQHFPVWIDGFQKINKAKSYTERRMLVLSMASDHPLYAWLVQSLLAEEQ